MSSWYDDLLSDINAPGEFVRSRLESVANLATGQSPEWGHDPSSWGFFGNTLADPVAWGLTALGGLAAPMALRGLKSAMPEIGEAASEIGTALRGNASRRGMLSLGGFDPAAALASAAPEKLAETAEHFGMASLNALRANVERWNKAPDAPGNKWALDKLHGLLSPTETAPIGGIFPQPELPLIPGAVGDVDHLELARQNLQRLRSAADPAALARRSARELRVGYERDMPKNWSEQGKEYQQLVRRVQEWLGEGNQPALEHFNAAIGNPPLPAEAEEVLRRSQAERLQGLMGPKRLPPPAFGSEEEAHAAAVAASEEATRKVSQPFRAHYGGRKSDIQELLEAAQERENAAKLAQELGIDPQRSPLYRHAENRVQEIYAKMAAAEAPEIQRPEIIRGVSGGRARRGGEVIGGAGLELPWAEKAAQEPWDARTHVASIALPLAGAAALAAGASQLPWPNGRTFAQQPSTVGSTWP